MGEASETTGVTAKAVSLALASTTWSAAPWPQQPRRQRPMWSQKRVKLRLTLLPTTNQISARKPSCLLESPPSLRGHHLLDRPLRRGRPRGRESSLCASFATDNSPSPTTCSFMNAPIRTSDHILVISAAKLSGTFLYPRFVKSISPNVTFFADDKTIWETTGTSTQRRSRSNAKSVARVSANQGHLLSTRFSTWRRVPTNVQFADEALTNARTSRPICLRTPTTSHMSATNAKRCSAGIAISGGTSWRTASATPRPRFQPYQADLRWTNERKSLTRRRAWRAVTATSTLMWQLLVKTRARCPSSRPFSTSRRAWPTNTPRPQCLKWRERARSAHPNTSEHPPRPHQALLEHFQTTSFKTRCGQTLRIPDWLPRPQPAMALPLMKSWDANLPRINATSFILSSSFQHKFVTLLKVGESQKFYYTSFPLKSKNRQNKDKSVRQFFEYNLFLYLSIYLWILKNTITARAQLKKDFRFIDCLIVRAKVKTIRERSKDF